MKTPYDDIIRLPHPISRKRKQMPLLDRAAQFAPFAALTGYEAVIAETGRLTESEFEWTEDGKELLNRKLRLLSDRIGERIRVTVTQYVPDQRKAGGAYRETRGILRRVDAQRQVLVLEPGAAIPFDRIYELEWEPEGQEKAPV